MNTRYVLIHRSSDDEGISEQVFGPFTEPEKDRIKKELGDLRKKVSFKKMTYVDPRAMAEFIRNNT